MAVWVADKGKMAVPATETALFVADNRINAIPATETRVLVAGSVNRGGAI